MSIESSIESRIRDLAVAARHKLVAHECPGWSKYLWAIHDHYLAMLPGPLAVP